ncbi:hypothetical protein DXA57_14870 [Blautia sp. OF03-15BH]|uniref:hypothetical protein n=1 Tax=Blautia sp. OF03-15BH TaxID=2292287 RepID=UPI000E5028EF|nr:hypothetical protein [Blautia sp. OF03-15BH]RGX98276.1 hypothetical protein DXA57_14870 [Blautia sp. OF03-15BH]
MGFTGGYYTGRGSDSSAAFMAVFLVLAVVLTVLAFIFIVPENRRAKLNAFGKFLHDTCNFNYLLIEKLLQALYIFLTVFSILTGVYTLFQSFGMGLLMMIGLPLLIRLIYEFLMMTVLLLKHVIMIDNKLKNQNTGDKKQQPEASVFASRERKKPAPAPAKEPVKKAAPAAKPVAKPAAERPAQPAKPAAEKTVPAAERPVQPVKPAAKPAPVSTTPEASEAAVTEKPAPVKTSPEAPARPKAVFCTECGSRLDENGKCPNCGK